MPVGVTFLALDARRELLHLANVFVGLALRAGLRSTSDSTLHT